MLEWSLQLLKNGRKRRFSIAVVVPSLLSPFLLDLLPSSAFLPANTGRVNHVAFVVDRKSLTQCRQAEDHVGDTIGRLYGSCESMVFTDRLYSKSGLPLCRYALGGAARSTQPTSLVHDYCESVLQHFDKDDVGNTTAMTTTTTKTKMAPFLFYYNPHRYADFMKGVREAATEQTTKNSAIRREDLFLASGGTDRSDRGMDQRLLDALEYSGGDYLDMFVLEYVCQDEVDDPEFLSALGKAHSWVKDGRVRFVAASTHSHRVGAWLGSLRRSSWKTQTTEPFLDAMMLRYNMAHKSAAERISFPVCSEAEIPVLAFTTTRWNRLQAGHLDWPTQNGDDELRIPAQRPPTTPECLSFALSPSSPSWESPESWPVEIVLHSARTTDELHEAMGCLSPDSTVELAVWRDYGSLEWNCLDGFDEYPEEQK